MTRHRRPATGNDTEHSAATAASRPGDAPAHAARVEATRAAVRTLPTGEITDADLARIGVTPEQFAELADADADHEAREYQADRAESRARRAEDLSTDQAYAIIARAAALDRHAGSCQLDAAQCPTCAELDRYCGGFWEIEVPAARQHVHELAGQDTTTGAERELVDYGGPDPWRPPAVGPAGSLPSATESADATHAAIERASAAVQKLAEHNAQAAALTGEQARLRQLGMGDSTEHTDDLGADLGVGPVLDDAPAPPTPEVDGPRPGGDR